MAETVEFGSNGGVASGYLATPSTGRGPGVLVIQEWWGLDSGIKEMADRLGKAGFVALAPDLYHGELAGHTEMDKAGKLMQSLPPDRAGRDMSGEFAARTVAITGAAGGIGQWLCRFFGKEGASNYAAAKGGLVALTKSLAREVARFGITVNAVSPGFVATQLVSDMSEAERTKIQREVPLGRFGRPEEVGAVVAFLASPRASWISGACVTVDGCQSRSNI